MKKLVSVLVVFLTVFVYSQAISEHTSARFQTTPWVAPASANALVNPVKGDAAATALGKATYVKYCVVCHGATGRGDGIASAGLQTPPADHSSAKIQGQTDGAIYWKITNGRNPM